MLSNFRRRFSILFATAAILCTFCSAISSAAPPENSLWLHNGTFEIPAPSNWVIIAHKPAGNRTVLAFQMHGNPAEEGTADSTNLAISTFNLKDTESMLAFTQPLMKPAGEGEKDFEMGDWAVREWSGKQEQTDYRILDARMTHNRLGLGLQVRLAWPLLKGNPKDYDAHMKTLLENLLKSLVTRNPEKK